MNKIIYLYIALFLLNACGDGKHKDTPYENAQKQIVAFIDHNSSTAPDTKTYFDLAVRGVDENNIHDINFIIKKRDLREKEIIQHVVSVYNNAMDKILGYTSNTKQAPSVADYESIGVYAVNSQNIDGINRELLKEKKVDVDTRIKIQRLVSHYVPDTEKPIIVLKGSSSIVVTVGDNYVDPGVTAYDNKDGNLTAKIQITGSVDTSKVGVYTVKYIAIDAAGNRADMITRTVEVKERPDTQKPIITLTGRPSITMIVAESYTDPGATAYDNKDGDITSSIHTEGIVNTNVAGVYTIKYSVLDSAGNRADEVSREVRINDRPVVEVSLSYLTTIEGYRNGLSGSATDPQGISKYKWSENGEVILSGAGKNSLSYLPSSVGIHEVVFSAVDNLAATGSKTIIVKVLPKPNRVLFSTVPSVTQKSYTRDNNKEVVTENSLNLMWQDNAEAESVTKSWEEANAYCKNLNLASHADWRLPSRLELVYLVDYSRSRPAIDQKFIHTAFSGNVPPADILAKFNPTIRYWTANTFTNNGARACWVEFSYGILHGDEKGVKSHVRCVRDNGAKNTLAVNYERKNSGVVLDKVTGLSWQDNFSDNGNEVKKGTWDEAVSYCQALNLDGKTDWELPNLNELRTLIDDMKKIPAQDPIFVNNPNYKSELQQKKKIYNWSATTYKDDSLFAWGVYNAFGGQHPREKTKTLYIRCVRK